MIQNIISLLATDNYLMYNLNIAKSLGIYEAIVIGELARKWNYWQLNNRLDERGFFYITREDLESDTGLSEYQQRQAMQHLNEVGILITEARGLPKRNFYKINDELLFHYLSLKNYTTGDENIERQDLQKVDITNTIITNTINTNINKEESGSDDPSSSKQTSEFLKETPIYNSEQPKAQAAFKDTDIPQPVAFKTWLSTLGYSKPVKQALGDWFDVVGHKSRPCYKQLKIAFNVLEELKADADKVTCINNATLGNYTTFKPEFVKTKQTHKTSDEKPKTVKYGDSKSIPVNTAKLSDKIYI